MYRDIVVVGSAVYDITGRFQHAGATAGDSNPGDIYSSCGGVGRNIAENAARIGLASSLISAWGQDIFAAELSASCNDALVDTSHVFASAKIKTSVYIDLLDHRGELVIAAADLTSLESVPAGTFSYRMDFINQHKLVCLDANLVESQLAVLAKGCTRPIMADTVSAAKATRLSRILPNIHTLKTNVAELCALTGRDSADRKGIEKAAGELLNAGVQRVFVTLGRHGACCLDRRGVMWQDGFKADVVSVTGAGDAFAAGIAYSILRELNVRDTLLFATAMAHLALAAPNAVNRDISKAKALRLAAEFGMP
ncbi:MAG: PfkB family carbohydrate kinase [Defluviitaleaceae bacterium]|nr:PfkB family carbohydrate kinase [Defluviitaleaceae bacterium]